MNNGVEKTIDLVMWKNDFADRMIGSSRLLLEQIRVAKRVADTNCTVLIRGETGTGKELMAQAIHSASKRAQGPFVAVNCAAIPDDLIEDELFGHVAGAFSGATKDRLGRIASAHSGTLFLDEVGELPSRAQAKLLRVVQERVMTAIGSDDMTDVDVRIVVATHRDLEAMVIDGSFRADLLYRLNVIPLDLPPLRIRGNDVLELAHAFLRTASEQYHRPITGFSKGAEQALLGHDWPGNVRELKNAVERATLLSPTPIIEANDLKLPPRIRSLHSADTDRLPTTEDLDLRRALHRTEMAVIERALERTGGNRSEAAALLGLNRTTLVEKLKKNVTGV